MNRFAHAVIVLCVLSTATAADVSDGIRAFNRGDYKTAEGHLNLGAQNGDVRAQWLMGRMSFEGLGVPRSDSEAFGWFHAAAQNGFVAAQNNVGYMHENGRGVVQDYAKAAEWYREAADTGHAGRPIQPRVAIRCRAWRAQGRNGGQTLVSQGSRPRVFSGQEEPCVHGKASRQTGDPQVHSQVIDEGGSGIRAGSAKSCSSCSRRLGLQNRPPRANRANPP